MPAFVCRISYAGSRVRPNVERVERCEPRRGERGASEEGERQREAGAEEQHRPFREGRLEPVESARPRAFAAPIWG